MSKKLAGRVAVVTGAGKGIGKAIAQQFAAEGAKVVVNYARSQADAEQVVAGIRAAGGEATALQADVSQRADVERLFAGTRQTWGALDILVNNAGIYEFLPLEAITEDHYRRQFDTNVLGPILTTQEAVKHFGPQGGNVINISSIVGLTPAAPGGLVYSATKAAVESLTRELALELSGRVRVNSIAPGMVETEGLAANNPDQGFKDYVLMRSPIKRLGVPDDIAKAALFLASDDSSWITGETLVVGGGLRI